MSEAPSDSLREELLRLDDQRKAVMKRIEEAMAFLATTPVGLHGRLVDDEGFPRDDCDLYAVRSARNTVNCGANDLKAIETALYEQLNMFHEENKDDVRLHLQQLSEAKKEVVNERECIRHVTRDMKGKSPFVRVVSVLPGSPGEEAGLSAGHLIMQYGDLDASAVAAQGLGEMARVTASHEGRMLCVWVKHASSADGEVQELFLVPQRWAGDGLLGCAFEPIPQG